VVCSEYERKILEKIKECLGKKKLIAKNNAVLSFDGIMVLENKQDNTNLLKEIELFISKSLGMNIQLKQKPFRMNLAYKEILDKINVPKVESEDNFRIVETDKEAADMLYEELKDNIKYCKEQIFFKHDKIWLCKNKVIVAALMEHTMNSNIYTQIVKEMQSLLHRTTRLLRI